ncbi:lysylphosphatidylglycerol synthase transmembrane domain-containing protein [Microlunatus sp. Gsoil 973]|uniref:lysylphosphatidylglycerol synthase transmembrane domain-containing protein n=1 Tax=Microlunatus sp. Gsoil 973 TaxID=2672569 RepID=UPI0018A83A65|nr:lysylphosphatidylglycerol synthase transmembrane domain-containing protein [Microlunatus sp. Gsoil 973]
MVEDGGPQLLSDHGSAGPRRDRHWRQLRSIGFTALTILVIEYLAVPQIVHATSDLTLFADASPLLLVLAFILEACSLAAYTALSRAVLLTNNRPGYFAQLRIDLTGYGVSHVIPGGGASAAALRFRLMTQRGVPATDAASSAVVQTAVTDLSLVATFAAGVILIGPAIADHPAYAVAGALAVIALLAGAIMVRRYSRRPTNRHHPVRRTPGRFAPRTILGPRVSQWIARVIRDVAGVSRMTASEAAQLARDPRRRLTVFGWAGGNWLFDAASLWVCLRAYHVTIDPGVLLTAYGAANLIALLPVSPGGLGIVEGVLIPALGALGDTTAAPVALGVLTWRLFQFWLPIPISGLTYLSLKLQSVKRSG